MSDNVNNPKHYTSHPSGIECIQVTEHCNFNIGNAIKYVWRAGDKGKYLEDLKKARWYVGRELNKLWCIGVENTSHAVDMLNGEPSVVAKHFENERASVFIELHKAAFSDITILPLENAHELLTATIETYESRSEAGE